WRAMRPTGYGNSSSGHRATGWRGARRFPCSSCDDLAKERPDTGAGNDTGPHMTPFAIAGVQMYVNALQPNTDGMIHRIDILMARFPWTQMVLFSALAPFGPLPKFALPFRNDSLSRFQDAARKPNIWLLPSSEAR